MSPLRRCVLSVLWAASSLLPANKRINTYTMTLRFPCSACPGFGFGLLFILHLFFGYHYSTHGHLSLLSVLLL